MKLMQSREGAYAVRLRGVSRLKSAMKQSIWALGVILAVGLVSCDKTDDNVGPNFIHTTDFNKDTTTWQTGIVDYNVQQEGIMEFSSKLTALPTDSTKKGLKLTSSNRSDDAFMYLTRKLTGLAPNQSYKIEFEVELASQYPASGVGVGGSPGGAVYLKAGASGTAPQRAKDTAGDWKLNWDKGAQSESGKDAVVLGNIGIEGDQYKYQLIKRNNQTKPFTAKTNDKGELWLLVGTDSGFEGVTTIYYTQVKAVLIKN